MDIVHLNKSKDRFDAESINWDYHQDRVERARQIAEQIFKLVPITQEMQVMDFGSGTGLLGFHFVETAKTVTFADTSKGMLEQVENKAKKGNFKNVNTIHLTEKPSHEQFDVIVSLLTLHHIENTQECVQNLASQLSPNGTLCICDLDQEDGSFHGEKRVPHNGFSRSDLAQFFQNSQLEDFQICTGMIEKKRIEGKMVEYPIFIAIGRKYKSSLD